MSHLYTELERVIKIMPYIRKLMGKEVNLGVTDLQKALYYDQGTSLSLGIKPGDEIKKGSLPDIAIKARRRISKFVPEDIYGKPYSGVSVPIKLNDRVIGTYFFSRPASMSGDSVALQYKCRAGSPKGEKTSIGEMSGKNGNEIYHSRAISSQAKSNNSKEKSNLPGQYTFDDLIFKSKTMENLIAICKKISINYAPVLIQGESGTGKEIIAHSIHNYGLRMHGPFIAINCAAMPRDLIQSELFGYEEGSFTGAKKGGKEGLFELARGGTIFLDEIGDMLLMTQANLLRVLQEKKVTRIGGYRVIPLDVRVIAATNKNLQERIKRNLFREDLYYRLSATVLSIPPLRERREDIGLLFLHFIERYRRGLKGSKKIRILPTVERILTAYDWPGNVRELENTVIGILSVLDGDTIEEKDLPPQFRSGADAHHSLQTLDVIEKNVINEALARCSNNISRAANALGISRPTLYRKMKKFKIIP